MLPPSLEFASPEGYQIRPSVDEDFTGIQGLLRPMVEARKVLRRTRAETLALLTTGFVGLHEDKIVGFCAVEIYSKKLAEIQCLVVEESHRSHGLGGALVRYCVNLAKQRGVREVMAISSSERFLHDLGFDYSLPDQKRALFFQLRSREEVYRELEASGDD